MMLTCLITSFDKNNTENRNNDKFVVVLDAGHGGHDPGNLGNGYLEKNIALNIVLQVGKILEINPGIKVIYTRKDDTFVDLYVRGEIANKANADLFVSVHCDSHTSDAHGAGTFVLGLHANKQNFEIAKKENSAIYLEDDYESRYSQYDINSPESIIGLTIMQEEFLDQSIGLAKMIQDNFTNKLHRVDRKVKQAGFIVLHQTFMPSVLVETGFLTNKQEGAYLNSKKGQTEMGTAIADAILEYKKDLWTKAPDEVVQAPAVDTTPQPDVVANKSSEKTEPKVAAQETPAGNEDKVEKGLDSKTQETVAAVTAPEVTSTAANEKETAKPEIPPVSKKNPEVTSKPSKAKMNIVFKVQLLASSKDMFTDPINFNGLNKISKEPFNNLYRYMYGSTGSYDEAQLLKTNAVQKGYGTAYIVAYKDDKRIPLSEALSDIGQK
ncbi:N-acetylmuramoyl-L-alanine amidase [Flavobacteriaceae bacterium F89]|uniref:N-acetylmuramoyl-L-alanine amidase n=2 Tax=Cerina litoralis TaxID=2874477 RepID=A0AAE3EVG1_9FLAO|nr:N-acetylmuramoyl-L-alanine amidase [Cerina litoralis]MCG2461260.1 N-acetylmuramoyl-L-alanine amidase [Cerina litoralis]